MTGDNELDSESGESGLNVEETEHAAEHWAEWAAHDVEHFLKPIAAKTGLSISDVLLYLISEHLGQIAEAGIAVHLHAKHTFEPPPEEDDDWKKGSK